MGRGTRGGRQFSICNSPFRLPPSTYLSGNEWHSTHHAPRDDCPHAEREEYYLPPPAQEISGDHNRSSLLFGCHLTSGDERARTANPGLAKPVLSQLSYVPPGSRLRVLPLLQWVYEDSNLGPHPYQSGKPGAVLKGPKLPTRTSILHLLSAFASRILPLPSFAGKHGISENRPGAKRYLPFWYRAVKWHSRAAA